MLPRTDEITKKGHPLDFIGGQLAIDFVNTARMAEGELTDTFETDADVKNWLVRAGIEVSGFSGSWASGVLLRKARELREVALSSIINRNAGKRDSFAALNSFLASAVSHVTLVRRGAQIEAHRIYHGRTPEEYLAPIAEGLADLLANADFDLVRQCEGKKCVLWFYDQTRSHHRKFCSAAGCGNRAKVAAYRARARKLRK